MTKMHNGTQYNTQYNDTLDGDTQHNRKTKLNPKTLCNTQHNDNLYNTLNLTTLSITTFSNNKSQHNTVSITKQNTE
jgi:hypothetical protein